MGKSKAGKGARRAAPYAKKAAKPSVEVTYEGTAPKPKGSDKATGSKKGKPEGAKATAKAPAPKEPKAKEAKGKGKGKAKAQPEPAALADAMEVDAEDAPGAPADTFKIIAGSYEKLLYGLEGSYAPGASKPTLSPIFIFPAHLSWVKAVAASAGGKWLATGSEDEFIKVWDLRRRKEVGSLSQHTGSITSLTFPTRSHLMATSKDATISLFRTSDWALLKSLKGHSGAVNCVDVHPTGRVALSVGKDNTLKMWDLMRGRGASSLQLGDEAELVKWSPRGTHFAVLYRKKVEVYSLTLKLLHTLETKSNFNTLTFAEMQGGAGEGGGEDEDSTELLCIGSEKGIVEVYRVELGGDEPVESDEDEDEGEDEDREAAPKGPSATVEHVASLIGHTNRVKSIAALPFVTPAGPTMLLATVSSDGLINLHDLSLVLAANGPGAEIAPVASYDTKGSRLVCVELADGGVPRKKAAAAGAAGAPAPAGKRATFAVPDEDDEDDGDDGEESGEESDGPDMYDSDEGEEEGSDGVEVEFEDDEEEDEGEYED